MEAMRLHLLSVLVLNILSHVGRAYLDANRISVNVMLPFFAPIIDYLKALDLYPLVG
jgi:hypothetical protein